MSNYRPPPAPPPAQFNPNAPYLTYPFYPPNPQYHYQQGQNAGSQVHGQPGSFHSPYQTNGYSFQTNGQSESTPSEINGITTPLPPLALGHSQNGVTQLPHKLPPAAPQRVLEAYPPVGNQEPTSAQTRTRQIPQQESFFRPVTDAADASVSGAAPVSEDLEEGELSDSESGGTSSQSGPVRSLLPSMPEVTSGLPNGSKQDIREGAKKALRELENNKISFLKVAAEIVSNELTAASLQELYAEIGVKISPADVTNASIYDTRSVHKKAATSNQTRQTNGETGKLLGLSSNSKVAEVSDGPLKINTNVTAPLPQAEKVADPVIPGTTLRLTEIVSPPSATPKDQVPIPGIASSRPQTAKSNEKTFDRKEYIARMLAAKKGKGAVTANDTASAISSPKAATTALETSLIHGSTLGAEVATRSSPDRGTIRPPSETTRPRQLQSDAGTSPVVGNNVGNAVPKGDVADNALTQATNASDAEAKKKAQTELARKKMDALLNRSNLQRTGQTKQGFTFTGFNTLPWPIIPPSPASASASDAQAIAKPAVVQHLPSFGGSAFSPVSGKPMFNLPGLFMSNESFSPVPNPVNASQTLPSKAQTIPTSDPQVISKVPEPAPDAHIPDQRKLSSTLPPEPTQVMEPSSAKALSTEIVNNTRKRHKASDFIEPPSTRLKRHLGLNEDKGVVIEVSEDEALDAFADDDAEMDVDTDQEIYGDAPLNPVVHSNLWQTDPLAIERRNSDFIKPNNAALHTPPLPSTPGPGVEFNGLRTKEKEIELMNRKIAELEQRRKAKQTSSRAQTPNMSENRSSPPKEAPAVAEAIPRPGIAHDAGESAISVEQRTVQKTLGISEHGNEAVQRVTELLEPLQLLQAHDPLSKLEEGTFSESEELQIVEPVPFKGQESEQLELERRQNQGLSAGEARSSEEQRTNTTDLERQIAHDDEKRALVDQRNSLEAAAAAERQQNVDRIEEIQGGLSRLDAEVEKTKKKFESLEAQVAETKKKLGSLEAQVEEHKAQLAYGIQGRQGLVDELKALQDSTRISSASAPDDDLDLGTDVAPISSATSTVADAQMSSESPKATTVNSNHPANGIGPDEARGLVFGNQDRLNEATSASASIKPLESGLVENVMDQAPSDVDEGEISEYSPEPPNIHHQEDPMEQDDSYEPPAVIETEPVMLSNGGSHESAAPFAAVASYPVAHREDRRQQAPDAVDTSTMSMDNVVGESASRSMSPSVSDADESDDYEPPEPSEPVSPSAEFATAIHTDVVQQQPTQDDANPEKYAHSIDQYQPPTSGLNDHGRVMSQDAETRAPSKEVAELDKQWNRFTPYESPLKHFKSYRYHPTYPGTVSDGFRSLTYSHNIDHDEPICPYETAGTCNDDSCIYQHLNRVRLSDAEILVQLGTAPKGLSSADEEEYSKGLRAVIRDIRARNVKDFDTVAAEITAHRKNFVGDSTKVLPL